MTKARDIRATPLARKLGLKPGCRVLARYAPEGYRAWLAPLPEGVSFRARASSAVDVAHLFVTRTAPLMRELAKLRRTLRPDAVVWVSWPKRSAATGAAIGEGDIRAHALPLGFVDVKVCAVSEVWSGLKLVVRKHLR